MEAGKDYFVDKAPMVTLQQLEKVKEVQERTGQKYAVYYCERLHTEAGVFAEKLIKQGAIGRVIQTIGLGPHRLNASARPSWFFKKEQYGGILCDIGSHQVEQFLFFTGATNAEIASAHVKNYKNPKHPGLEDFGDCNLMGNNGATGYFRVDWLTPDGLSIWGDGRLTILGTDGYMELRTYVDVARDKTGDHIYLVTQDGEYHIPVRGKVGFPYFGQLVLDCIHRTETAMTQVHAFKAAELCIKAQMYADAKIIV
ncbi:MAG: Gfo/Idh/MocA family oxidoreductase, partial [Defluviitaleaceae bacterium]|nr:Gfo/Idh/MocA family oxidoreductase [Defluviitaleaceae bacterium]